MNNPLFLKVKILLMIIVFYNVFLIVVFLRLQNYSKIYTYYIQSSDYFSTVLIT